MKQTCSCCGLERDPATLVGLQNDEEIRICRDCIGWLAQRSGMLDVTPTLPVRAMPEAIGFYETAGFDVDSYDGGFAFVRYAGASVFDLDLNQGIDPTNNGTCRRSIAPPYPAAITGAQTPRTGTANPALDQPRP